MLSSWQHDQSSEMFLARWKHENDDIHDSRSFIQSKTCENVFQHSSIVRFIINSFQMIFCQLIAKSEYWEEKYWFCKSGKQLSSVMRFHSIDTEAICLFNFAVHEFNALSTWNHMRYCVDVFTRLSTMRSEKFITTSSTSTNIQSFFSTRN